MINEERAFGFLATCEGVKPKVRPMSAKYFSDKILCSTFSNSDKVKQLKGNDNCEMTWMFDDMSHLRVSGKIQFINELEMKGKFLDFHPMLKEYFKQKEDPNYALFEIIPEKVQFMGVGAMDYTQISW